MKYLYNKIMDNLPSELINRSNLRLFSKLISFDIKIKTNNIAIKTIINCLIDIEKELVYCREKTSNSILVKQKEGSTNTILVFSAVYTKKGSFTFFKTFENLDVNVVLINDYKSRTYENGTPDFFSEYEFEKYIKDILELLGTKQLFTFGSSMGGYAALKYGSIFQADSIITMSPKITLAMPLTPQIEIMIHLQGAGDLSRLKFKNPSKVYHFTGNEDLGDYYTAVKMNTINPGFKTIILNNQPHSLAPIINEIINLSLKYSELNTALEFSEWSSVQYYSYLIYKKLKDIDNQEKNLLKSLKSKKTYTVARLAVARLYFNRGKLHMALEYLLVLKGQKFSFGCGDLLYKVLVKLERHDEAKEVLEEISKLVLNANNPSSFLCKHESIDSRIHEDDISPLLLCLTVESTEKYTKIST